MNRRHDSFVWALLTAAAIVAVGCGGEETVEPAGEAAEMNTLEQPLNMGEALENLGSGVTGAVQEAAGSFDAIGCKMGCFKNFVPCPVPDLLKNCGAAILKSPGDFNAVLVCIKNAGKNDPMGSTAVGVAIKSAPCLWDWLVCMCGCQGYLNKDEVARVSACMAWGELPDIIYHANKSSAETCPPKGKQMQQTSKTYKHWRFGVGAKGDEYPGFEVPPCFVLEQSVLEKNVEGKGDASFASQPPAGASGTLSYKVHWWLDGMEMSFPPHPITSKVTFKVKAITRSVGNDCVDQCGGKSPAGCYCDAACHKYNDCCEDKTLHCGP